MRYAIVIESAGNNDSAHIPDLPGCVTMGDTLEDAELNIREAIALRLEGLREDGLPVTASSTVAKYCEFAA